MTCSVKPRILTYPKTGFTQSERCIWGICLVIGTRTELFSKWRIPVAPKMGPAHIPVKAANGL
ncbi:hypothetical protein DPMN_149024 [Dreissena polymorpha]|uniref:Uncharacterized protein n=1 Tax=Dreissena polymorpha TaxID=45954 RepID=A0A9D4J0S2_DREPO|nr:hypothetical protein DPMN_149024 [Dreissena polymorpha]